MRIAVYQMAIVPSNVKENFEKIDRFLSEAQLQGVDLAVVPECCLTGVLDLAHNPDLVDHDGAYLQRFKQMCKKYRIDLVTGSFREKVSDAIFNVSYYVDWNGDVLARYAKRHLWHTERSACTPGLGISIAHSRFGKIGLAICWDLAFAEHFQELSMKEVDVIVCSSYWSYEDAGIGQEFNKTCEVDFVNASTLSRAYETESIMVFANAAEHVQPGMETGLIGQSQVCLPILGRVGHIEHNGEEVLTVDCDLEVLPVARHVYGIRSDLNSYAQIV